MKKGIVSFGFSTVNAGQRNVAHEPQLIALSVNGGFKLTGPVTAALSLTAGDYVMFINNIDNINDAIRDEHPAIVEFCEANGLDIKSPEAIKAIHNEFDMWLIAKGVQKLTSKGLPEKITERLTMKDKQDIARNQFSELLAAAMESDNAELKDRLTIDGITEEQQIAILAEFIQPKEVDKYMGSKLANPSGLTGTGVSLTFTDSNVWNTFKAEMSDEDKAKFNRTYEIALDEIQTIQIYDGYKTVEVKALPIGASTDVKVATRTSKKDNGAVEGTENN